jgi:hypothetical protein
MLTGKLESDFAMVEIMAIGINPIMASQAVIAISLDVGLHEISLDLLVTGNADSLVKHYIAIHVAGFTNKKRTICLGERLRHTRKHRVIYRPWTCR